MGHTLVAQFAQRDLAPLAALLEKWQGAPVNKIPFGRDCHRELANQILPYHMTILHWARGEDREMLPKMQHLRLPPLTVTAAGLHVMPAEEGSRLLYLSIRPGPAYESWRLEQERALGVPLRASFLHVTLAVGKDAGEIDRLAEYLRRNLRLPLELKISCLALYHIWRPVRLTAVWKPTV